VDVGRRRHAGDQLEETDGDVIARTHEIARTRSLAGVKPATKAKSRCFQQLPEWAVLGSNQ
jgi:hypothetical protein